MVGTYRVCEIKRITGLKKEVCTEELGGGKGGGGNLPERFGCRISLTRPEGGKKGQKGGVVPKNKGESILGGFFSQASVNRLKEKCA